jgi:hypothetical protein
MTVTMPMTLIALPVTLIAVALVAFASARRCYRLGPGSPLGLRLHHGGRGRFETGGLGAHDLNYHGASSSSTVDALADDVDLLPECVGCSPASCVMMR